MTSIPGLFTAHPFEQPTLNTRSGDMTLSIPRAAIVRTVLALLAIMVSASGAPLGAQVVAGGAALSAAETLVAIPSTFPDVDARAMVVREPGQDVIVLAPGEATTDALFMALVLLADVRERTPTPTHGQMIPISGFSVDQPPTGRELGRLEALLTRLERAPVTDLGTLGRGRLVRYHPAGGPG